MVEARGPEWQELENGERLETVPDGWVKCPVCNYDELRFGPVGMFPPSSSVWCWSCLPKRPPLSDHPWSFTFEWHLQRGQYPGWVASERAVEVVLAIEAGVTL